MEQLAKCWFCEILVLQMTTLLCTTDEVRKTHRRSLSHIPLEIEPVTTLDSAFPVSEKQGVHLAGKQVWQAEAFDIEGKWLEKQFFLGCKTQCWYRIDLKLDLDNFVRMNGNAEKTVSPFRKADSMPVRTVFLLADISTSSPNAVNSSLTALKQGSSEKAGSATSREKSRSSENLGNP